MNRDLLNLVIKDRKRRSRREALGKFVVEFVSAAVLSLLYGWEFMLAVGVIHLHWLPVMPTIGYWWAVLVVWLLRAIFTPNTSSAKAADR